jgi:hypothetical protein
MRGPMNLTVNELMDTDKQLEVGLNSINALVVLVVAVVVLGAIAGVVGSL